MGCYNHGREVFYVFNYRRVSGNCFKATEISALAFVSKWVNLDVADFADVTVASQKNLAVHDNTSTGTIVDAN